MSGLIAGFLFGVIAFAIGFVFGVVGEKKRAKDAGETARDHPPNSPDSATETERKNIVEEIALCRKQYRMHINEGRGGNANAMLTQIGHLQKRLDSLPPTTPPPAPTPDTERYAGTL